MKCESEIWNVPWETEEEIWVSDEDDEEDEYEDYAQRKKVSNNDVIKRRKTTQIKKEYEEIYSLKLSNKKKKIGTRDSHG